MKLEGVSMGSSSACCILTPKVFFELSKINEMGKYIIVYRSELSLGDTPSWEPFTLTMRSICNGDKDRGLRLQCLQEGLNGYHSSLGSLYTTVNKLAEIAGVQDGVPLLGSDNRVSSIHISTAKEHTLPFLPDTHTHIVCHKLYRTVL